MSQAIDEPGYEVLQKLGESIEIRRYPAYVVAEVLIAGSADEAGNQAFPILAGYIFGKNKGERKFAMTAPVTQTSAPAKFAMTAPVTQSAADGGTLVRFVLPTGVTLSSAPEPIDERVKLREVVGHTLAAIRYSGFWSKANDADHLEQLHAALRDAKLTWVGEPVLARYNAPWTPWFLRRNELWLNLP
ncbi:MAG: heme-binding protein [Rhodoferax sp.]|nr:heme-binding protein [Rhodoferax sp.]